MLIDIESYEERIEASEMHVMNSAILMLHLLPNYAHLSTHYYSLPL